VSTEYGGTKRKRNSETVCRHEACNLKLVSEDYAVEYRQTNKERYKQTRYKKKNTKRNSKVSKRCQGKLLTPHRNRETVRESEIDK